MSRGRGTDAGAGRRWRPLLPVLLLALVLPALIACIAPEDEQGETSAGRYVTATATHTPSPTATPSPTLTPTPSPTATPTPPPAAAEPAGNVMAAARVSVRVTSLRIPKLGVSSGIEYIGLTRDNYMDTPKNPLNTGWYSIYDAPGLPGNALFAAHVDYYPNIKGPFNKLSTLVPGDEIVLVVDGAELRYQVASNNRYRAASMNMGAIIWPARPAGEEWITLITCGGTFVTTHSSGAGEYLDRDVVIAKRIKD